MKSILKFSLLFIGTFSFAQNNLIDTSTWTIGNGSADGFWRIGTDAENVREMGTDPHGNTSVLWKAIPDDSSDGDGGWNSPYMTTDHTKTYRFTVWIKKTNSNDGSTYFGPYTYDEDGDRTSLRLDGSATTNPYFFSADLPELETWYLLVGFLHESGYSSTVSQGGIYDQSGVKVQDLTDFKFLSTSTKMRHRAYLYYDTNTADRQFFWRPTIYEVNGQEPAITELIDPGTSGNGSEGTQQTVWNTSGNDIHYNGGNVGIGTELPTAILEIDKSINNTWATKIKNGGGDALGLLVQAGYGGSQSTNDPTILQLEDGNKNLRMKVQSNGKVGIGTAEIPNGYKLAVDGKVITEEVRVQPSGDWPDYVLAKGYDLPTLEEVENFIKKKGHLIHIPPAAEVEANGIELGEMNKLLLEKIEELTLYILEQEKRILRLEHIGSIQQKK